VSEIIVPILVIVMEYAAQRRRVEMMEMLHDCGLDIGGDAEHHPLSVAAVGGSLDTVKWLIERGADPCKEDRISIVKEYAQTPIVIAVYHGHVHILRHPSSVGISLRNEDPDYDALHAALRDHRPNILVYLLQSGVRFETSDPPMEKALDIAVEKKDEEIARLLLQAGADPDAKEDCVAFREYSDEIDEYTTHWRQATTHYGTLFQWACA
jgi:ankyrin repeat protein